MTQRVNEYYDKFTPSVAKGRGVSVGQVKNGMGQGRVVGADPGDGFIAHLPNGADLNQVA
jgi:hypothetical protein